MLLFCCFLVLGLANFLPRLNFQGNAMQCNAMQCSGQIPLTHANRVLTAPHFQLWESWFSSAQLSFLSSILHLCFCSDHSGALVGWFEPLLMTRPSPIIPHLPPCHATLLRVMGALRVGLLYRVMALVQDSIYHDATDFCGRGGRKMDCLLLSGPSRASGLLNIIEDKSQIWCRKNG